MIRRSMAVLVMSLALLAGPARADDAGALAQKIIDAHGAALVTVKVTIRMHMSSGGREIDSGEHTHEFDGTVVDSSGLTIVSNFFIDPLARLGANTGLKERTEIVGVKLVTADDVEIPCEVVLRDPDLDLAVLRPRTPPSKPLPFIELKTASTPPHLLDPVLVLGRLGRELNRDPMISLSRLEALVSKPRQFYVTDLLTGMTSFGCPVFDMEGEAMGLIIVRNRGGGGATSFVGGLRPVVLPSAAILDLLDQARKTGTR
jgi:S1-C subfamily serine protease